MPRQRGTASRRKKQPAGTKAKAASATAASKPARGTAVPARGGDRRKKRPTALITGASAGIGLALARVFAAHGHDLVVVARSGHKLRALAREIETAHGATVTVVPKDLTAADAPRTLAASLRRRGIEVDVLVNDAGILEQGEFR